MSEPKIKESYVEVAIYYYERMKEKTQSVGDLKTLRKELGLNLWVTIDLNSISMGWST